MEKIIQPNHTTMTPVFMFLFWVALIFGLLAAIAVALLFFGAGMNEEMDDETNDLPKQ